MKSLNIETAFAASITGLLLHVLYNRHEPRIQAFFVNMIGLACLWAVFIEYLSSSYLQAILQTTLFITVHLAVLALSIALYRLLFHPLRQFPGPWGAKLTKWVDFYHTAPGKRHECKGPYSFCFTNALVVQISESNISDS